MNFVKTCAAAIFTVNNTSDEFIILNNISTVIHAKSSDVSQKHPAANNDALTCKSPIKYLTYILIQIINKLKHKASIRKLAKQGRTQMQGKLGEWPKAINLGI